MSAPVSSSAAHTPVFSTGFRWNAADAYLFDIDGTLLNSRDSVHYFAFQHAVREVFGIEAGIDGVPVHGNTDIGIVRAVLRRAGLTDAVVDAHLPRIVEQMCAEVHLHRKQMQPEVCPSIHELTACLWKSGKLLGAASGNLEPIGWMKLVRAKLKPAFSFGSFAWPRESRAEILEHGIELARQRLGPAASICAVGDTPADIQAAKTVGIPIIALATGIYPFPELLGCGPDACLACASDLLARK